MIRRTMRGRKRSTAGRRDLSRSEITAGMLQGIEDALWLPAWADAMEEAGQRPPQNITRETADPMPAAVGTAARKVAREIARLNGGRLQSLAEVWRRASAADGREADPNELGYYLTMQALGHGVSWEDDHAPFAVKLPRVEANVFPSRRPGRWTFNLSMSRGR